MTTYKLYVKTHSVTGLKYLGYTTASNPARYLGSGVRWSQELADHGKEHTTEIIFESLIKKEVTEQGRQYSALWNIVQSNEWANAIPETGGGGGGSKPGRKLKQSTRIKQSVSLKKLLQDPIERKKRSDRMTTEWALNRSKRLEYITPEFRALQSIKTITKWNDPAYKAMHQKSTERYSKSWIITSPDGIVYTVVGLAAFCRTHTLSEGSMRHVAKGRQPNFKGWLCQELNP